jgi:hypothetical protein
MTGTRGGGSMTPAMLRRIKARQKRERDRKYNEAKGVTMLAVAIVSLLFSLWLTTYYMEKICQTYNKFC